MGTLPIIAAAWLSIVSASIVQDTSLSLSSPGTNTAGDAYSDVEERKAWILALRRFSESNGSDSVDWQPLLTTLAGGFVAGITGFLGLWYGSRRESERERLRMQHEAEVKAGEASRAAAVAYAGQLQKQVEILFGPLHSYLQQSRGIYQKIEMQLLEDAANYRKAPDSEQGEKLQLRVPPNDQGTWQDFRLLDQMPVLKQQSLYRPLLGEIMRLGEQMTNLIQQHGGMLHDGASVSDVYGEYLAHYAILKNIHVDDKLNEAFPPGKHKMGYYPRRLNGIVKRRYDALLAELAPYQEANKAALAELHRSANTSG